MRPRPVIYVALRFFAGRRDPSGTRDHARRALAGAVASVAISLVPLITVTQISDGMIRGISARYVELATYHARAVPYASLDLEAARDAAKSAPGVSGAWIETQSAGIAFSGGRKEGVAVRGVEPSFLADPSTKAYLRVDSGDTALAKPNDAVLGSAMAAKLGVGPGDAIGLITVRDSPDGPTPRVATLVVRGTVSAGYRDLDAQWLFIRQDAAARILPRRNSRSFVGVKGGDPFTAPDSAKEAIEGRLPPGFVAYSWRESERNLFESLASTRTMLLLIMAVTVVVASVNVSSALSTLVIERRQEIGVLSALGAGPGDLATLFAFGGLLIGAAGAVLGAAGGLLASVRINEILKFAEGAVNALRALGSAASGRPLAQAYRILDPGYYLESIPVSVDFWEIASVVAATVALSFAASIGPARKAASLSPHEAMRRR